MPTYQELAAQKAALDSQIEEARKTEVSAAAAEVKRLVGEYGLTAVKYRGANGEAWTGRGRAPAWVVMHEAAGNSRESLLAH